MLKRVHTRRPAAAGGGTWVPTDLTNIEIWLDANDSGTITESSGAVSQWDDKSGNAYHATQSTPGNRPTTGLNTIDSKNVIYFDDANNEGFSITVTTIDVANIFQVFKTTDDDWVIAHGAIGSNEHSYSAAQGGGAASYGSTFDTDTTPAMYKNGTLTAVPNNGTFYTLTATGSAMQVGMMQGDTTAWGTSWYLCNYTSGGYSYTGDLAEFVVVSGTMTTLERQKMEGYLGHKWGLEGSLPADHPYKSSAP